MGEFRPNAFGLFDMHGNVWEWCEDGLYDYATANFQDPRGPVNAEMYVLRGACFM